MPPLMGFKGFVRSLSTSTLSAQFKDAMAGMASPVMILTAAFQASPPDPAKMHGTVLSSVTSLAADPPLMQFNMQMPSATSQLLHRFSYFALHTMKPNEDSVRLANAFSQGFKSKDVPTKPFAEIDKNAWRVYDIGGVHIPILTDSSERIIICEKYKVFPMHNHEVWTCKVQDIIDSTPGNDAGKGGLLYFDRGYHELGDRIE